MQGEFFLRAFVLLLVIVPIVVQIADFGLSRDLQDGEYYKSTGGQIPVKWTSPEVRRSYGFVIHTNPTTMSCTHLLCFHILRRHWCTNATPLQVMSGALEC